MNRYCIHVTTSRRLSPWYELYHDHWYILNSTFRYVAVINTYLALCSACVATFITSILTNPKRRITMEHIQNATLAGKYPHPIFEEHHFMLNITWIILMFKFQVVSPWVLLLIWMLSQLVLWLLVSLLVLFPLLVMLTSRWVRIWKYLTATFHI